jgi:archaellum component FlaF (FlaF/FlaG flagellin family)
MDSKRDFIAFIVVIICVGLLYIALNSKFENINRKLDLIMEANAIYDEQH